MGTRVLGFACRCVVALWIAGALVWSSLAPLPATDEPSSQTARVQPRPERAASAPEPKSTEPSLVRVGRVDLRDGDKLLASGGSFPALSCSYDDFPSFREYARAMNDLGARFVVVSQRKVVAAIDIATGALRDAALDTPFSPRARDYAGEPALTELARRVRDRFGEGAAVMMLVPRDVDAGLFGGIARVLSRRGEHHDAYSEIRGRYERAPGGGVRLRVDTGVLRNGAQVALDLLFDLGDIARTGLASGKTST